MTSSRQVKRSGVNRTCRRVGAHPGIGHQTKPGGGALVFLLACAVGGELLGGLVVLGLVGWLCFGVATLVGHARWARLHTRGATGAVSGAFFAVMSVAAVLSPQPPTPERAQAPPSPRPATSTSSAVPTPHEHQPVADVHPYDASCDDSVATADGGHQRNDPNPHGGTSRTRGHLAADALSRVIPPRGGQSCLRRCVSLGRYSISGATTAHGKWPAAVPHRGDVGCTIGLRVRPSTSMLRMLSGPPAVTLCQFGPSSFSFRDRLQRMKRLPSWV